MIPMTFRWFIFFCSVCGGWAALVGWGLGRMIAGSNPVGGAGVKGLCLGMLLALALTLLDTLWNYSRGQVLQMVPRILMGVLVGTVGGLLGGVVGQLLYGVHPVFFVLGWALTGLLVGAALGTFDVLFVFVNQEEVRGPRRKVRNGVLGGTVGGLLGGSLSLLLGMAWSRAFHPLPGAEFWSPSATGFVALGMCIGLMVSLTQVLLRECWLKIESGFRAGRELLLIKPVVTIGRAEACDIGLFGDPEVERLHARILRKGDQLFLADAGSNTGTFLNDQRISEPTPLHSGDAIRVGKAVLRFGERQKRSK
jgi:hypothetical protein